MHYLSGFFRPGVNHTAGAHHTAGDVGYDLNRKQTLCREVAALSACASVARKYGAWQLGLGFLQIAFLLALGLHHMLGPNISPYGRACRAVGSTIWGCVGWCRDRYIAQASAAAISCKKPINRSARNLCCPQTGQWKASCKLMTAPKVLPGADAGGVRVPVLEPELLEELGLVLDHPVQRIPLRK